MFSSEKIMRSPSTLAVCTASGIMLTESPSSGLLDDETFDEEDGLLAGALEITLDEELGSTLLSVPLDEVSSALEESEPTGSEESVELLEAALLELAEL